MQLFSHATVVSCGMPGGTLAIEVDDNFFVRMTGPIGTVAEGKLSGELLGGGHETIETVDGIQYRTGPHVTLPGVLDLYRANGWSSAEKPQQLLSALLGSHSLVYAWDGERLVGLGNAITDGHLVVYYPHLLVHPEYQGRGVGTHLVRMLMTRYAGFHQHMLVADGKAIEFYRKCGFERAVTDARNESSVRVLERAGFHQAGEQQAIFKGEACIEPVYVFRRRVA